MHESMCRFQTRGEKQQKKRILDNMEMVIVGRLI